MKFRFQGKFAKIVAAEQHDNFITKLHRGRLDICPWPTITDPAFYALFNGVRKQLDQSPLTYVNAKGFVQTLKVRVFELLLVAAH